MHVRSIVIAIVSAALAGAAQAQANSFQLINTNGRIIGKASYTIDKTRDGFKVKTRFEYRTGIAVVAENPDPNRPTTDGSNVTDAQYTGEYKTDASGNFLSGYTQNSATQSLTSFSPSRTRDQIEIAVMQGGINGGSKTMPMPKPDYVLAPDYDPSAMQLLLTGSLAHPHADHIYLLAIPASSLRGSAGAAYITIADPTDATGTLDGKPVALKRYALGWNKAKGALYADAAGTLMQADIGTLKINYVRAKFKLDESAAK